MKEINQKKYTLTNYKKELNDWEKDFAEKYEIHIRNLFNEIFTAQAFSTKALKIGRENLKGIKTMENSTYTISSVLSLLYREYPKIGHEIISKIEQKDREVPTIKHQLVTAKAHEYHIFTEEMNVTMRLLIDFEKLIKIKHLNYNSNTWNSMIKILNEFSKNNKFLDYLLDNKELRNAIAHCTIWYDSGKLYYYSHKLGNGKLKNLSFEEFLKKTKELNILVLVFFYIFTEV